MQCAHAPAHAHTYQAHPKPAEKEVREAFAFFKRSERILGRKRLVVDVCGSHVSPAAYPHVRHENVRQGGAPLSWPLPSY